MERPAALAGRQLDQAGADLLAAAGGAELAAQELEAVAVRLVRDGDLILMDDVGRPCHAAESTELHGRSRSRCASPVGYANGALPRRSLWPREHGAYFQLAIPLVVALAWRAPRIAGLAWAAAACLAFLAHEPLLVMLGHRGARMRSSEAGRARNHLTVLGGGAVALGGAALVLLPPAARSLAALSLAPVAAVVALAWRRSEHTLVGELVAAAALTGAVAPVLAADGAAPGAAAAIWLGWAVGFGASVVAVHRVIARHKRAASWLDMALAVGLAAVAGACLATAARSVASLVAAPLVTTAAVLVVFPPPASRLRAVGVAIAASAGAAGVLLLAR
ncbi:MAG: hypothetical protein E6J90_48270 [Deltaproteobacteria bacterium]|nr:MAG: hypothetical protein E6J90_48270 [Deltaproteobacteria bacterium]